ncbi:hypothetical protein O6H91_20G051000 [Diphasiastrum complanatum]|uniref:Uncharacterized protein n=1 Tax=Diphasiastrum complanatum TaxID=34168 RepID=A0ACC2AQ90_DIPCM|nr:hypothetical protein O6H91_20G051000 [Diphasiastrum complanatum]
MYGTRRGIKKTSEWVSLSVAYSLNMLKIQYLEIGEINIPIFKVYQRFISFTFLAYINQDPIIPMSFLLYRLLVVSFKVCLLDIYRLTSLTVSFFIPSLCLPLRAVLMRELLRDNARM